MKTNKIDIRKTRCRILICLVYLGILAGMTYMVCFKKEFSYYSQTQQSNIHYTAFEFLYSNIYPLVPLFIITLVLSSLFAVLFIIPYPNFKFNWAFLFVSLFFLIAVIALSIVFVALAGTYKGI